MKQFPISLSSLSRKLLYFLIYHWKYMELNWACTDVHRASVSHKLSSSVYLSVCQPIFIWLSLSLSFSSETELLPAPFVSGTAPLDDRKSGNSVKYCKCWFDSEMPFTKPLLQFRNFFRFWKNWRGRKWIRLCAHSIRDSHFKSQTKIWSRLQQPMRVGNSSDTVVP